MTGLDAELIREVNAVVDSRDFDALAERMHPDVVWEHNTGVGSPEEGVYRGRESVVALLGRIVDAWESLRAEERELRDLGDGRYLVKGVLRAKHRTTQTEFDTPYEQLIVLRDGLLVFGRMVSEQGLARRQADNIELVHAFVEAFNSRDIDSVAAFTREDVVLEEWPTALGAQTFTGIDGVRVAIDAWFETWEWMRVRVIDVFATGDHVVITLHQRAKGKGSEIEVEITSHNVYSFTDGKVSRIALFTEREPALTLAGLNPDYEQATR